MMVWIVRDDDADPMGPMGVFLDRDTAFQFAKQTAAEWKAKELFRHGEGPTEEDTEDADIGIFHYRCDDMAITVSGAEVKA